MDVLLSRIRAKGEQVPVDLQEAYDEIIRGHAGDTPRSNTPLQDEQVGGIKFRNPEYFTQNLRSMHRW